ncbi:MAG: HNH endonuclease signature motif containing protein, partial [Bdellovibrionota bacterium]
DFKESKKFVSKDRLRVTHTIAVSIEDKLDRIKQLRTHVNPYMTREELLDYMAEVTLNAIDPVRRDERVRKREEKKVRKSEETLLVPTPELTSAVPAQEPPLEFKEEIVSEAGEIQLVARLEERSRYISAAEDRKVREKSQNQGCAYVDPETGRRCESTHQLQRDHIVEYSQGGSNEHENLQLYCSQHNRFRWRHRGGPTVREARRQYA